MRETVRILSVAAVLAFAGWSALAQVPGEIRNLSLDIDKQTLNWDVEPGATSYHVYRGYLSQLSPTFYGTVLESEITTNTFVDQVNPVAGHGFFYIVTGASGLGEGTMGDTGESMPAERPNTYAWPGVEVAGHWSDPIAWPHVAIHTTLLHNGQVMTWQGQTGSATYVRWDPVTETFVGSQTIDSDTFCGGHSFLADGGLYVTGGTITGVQGLSSTWLYDVDTDVWTEGPSMVGGRYYPTNVTSGDGEVFVLGGRDALGEFNPKVEVFNVTTGLTEWTTAERNVNMYPAAHLMPDGRIFHTGPQAQTWALDPTTQTWDYIAANNFGWRGTGTGDFHSVMLPPGNNRIMIVGGETPLAGFATNTAEIIDYAAATPTWTYTTPMHFARKHLLALILPDGKVLVAGGGMTEETPTFPAEMFDPATETWTVLDSVRSDFRIYHSSSVLLPDGRAMWLGGQVPVNALTAGIYSPGYLFKGPRPTITAVASSVQYGATLTVTTPDAMDITSVVFIRPSATTHSRNMTQRYVQLAFAPGVPGTLDVTAPSNPNVAPPGYYMLFLLNSNGVPSIAEFVQLTP